MLQKKKKFTVEGYYEIEGNSLYFHPAAPDIKTLEIKGKWKLDSQCNLLFLVNKSQNQLFGRTITFKTIVESASKNKVVFSFQDRLTPSFKKIKRIAFTGRWSSDRFNRLTFKIKRKTGYPGQLVFNGSWDITKNHSIIYSYVKENLKTKTKRLYAFVLRGGWELSRNHISYRIENSNTTLRFSAQLKSKKIAFFNNHLDYIIGIGIETRRGIRKKSKTISFWGKWVALSHAVGFKINMKSKVKTYLFSVEKAFSQKDKLIFSLRNKKDKKLLLEVEFDHRFSKDALLFLKAGGQRKEFSVGAGINWRF